VEWDVDDFAAGHFNVAYISGKEGVSAVKVGRKLNGKGRSNLLVEEGLEYYNFIAWFQEAHECAEHACDQRSIEVLRSRL